MEHPWSEAANEFGLPSPLPTMCKWDSVAMGGKTENPMHMVLLTAATPSGVHSFFLDLDAFREMLRSGREIIKDIEESEKENHVTVATTTDLRDAIRSRKLLNGEIK